MGHLKIKTPRASSTRRILNVEWQFAVYQIKSWHIIIKRTYAYVLFRLIYDVVEYTAIIP
jgi:hypothetical protein